MANTSASGGMRSKFLRGFNLVSFFAVLALFSGTEILGDDTETRGLERPRVPSLASSNDVCTVRASLQLPRHLSLSAAKSPPLRSSKPLPAAHVLYAHVQLSAGWIGPIPGPERRRNDVIGVGSDPK